MDRKKALASVLAGLCSISSSALAGGLGEKNILKRPRSQSVGGRSRMYSPSSIRGAIKAGDRKNRFDRSRSPVSGRSGSGSTRDRSKGSTSSKDLKGKAVVLNQNVSTSKSDNSLLKLLLTGGGALLLGGAGVGIPTYFVTKKKSGSPVMPVNNIFSVTSLQIAHALGFIDDNTVNCGGAIPNHFFVYMGLLYALDSLKFEANKDQMCITCKVKEGFPTTFQGVETAAAQIAKLKFKFAFSEEKKLSIDSVAASEQFNFPPLVWLCNGSNCKTVGSTLAMGLSSNNDFLGKVKSLLAEALFRSFIANAVNNANLVNNMYEFNDKVCISLLSKTIN